MTENEREPFSTQIYPHQIIHEHTKLKYIMILITIVNNYMGKFVT